MDKETWLLGSLAPQWDGNILPTSKDVLNSIQFYYLLYKKTLTHSEALDKLSNHLWYLGPEYVPLVLFLTQIEQ
jgi:hypothetical protein